LYWYVLRTLAGQEDKSLTLLQYLFKDIQFIFPKRRLSWRKKGAILDVIKPLFRGYLFVSAEDKRIKELDDWMRDKKVDIWFVKIDKLITPITNEEVQLIKQLISNGEIVGRSVLIKIGEEAKIVSGPLVGFEGIVEKYSKRDRRVTIKVTVNGEEKRVELEGMWLEAE
jgi:transcriptional antiterminator NusG